MLIASVTILKNKQKKSYLVYVHVDVIILTFGPVQKIWCIMFEKTRQSLLFCACISCSASYPNDCNVISGLNIATIGVQQTLIPTKLVQYPLDTLVSPGSLVLQANAASFKPRRIPQMYRIILQFG